MKSKISIVAVSYFKKHCLEITKNLKIGQTLIITNRGQSVVEVRPIDKVVKKSLVGLLQDQATIKTSLLKSIGEKWNAEQ